MGHAKLTPVRILIILLTVATAIIHFSLAGGDFFIPFLLNGIGYLVLVAVAYFPVDAFDSFRRQAKWALLAFTAVTFILYFVFNWPNIWGTLGLIDKAIELVLMILIFVDLRE